MCLASEDEDLFSKNIIFSGNMTDTYFNFSKIFSNRKWLRSSVKVKFIAIKRSESIASMIMKNILNIGSISTSYFEKWQVS